MEFAEKQDMDKSIVMHDTRKVERFSQEAPLFSSVFLFSVQHHGKKLIAVEDEIIRYEFIEYVFLRKGQIRGNIEDDAFGYYVVETIPDKGILDTFSCVSVISINHELLDELGDLDCPCFNAVLDANYIPGDDYWTERKAPDENLHYPNVECFLMNEQLKPMFTNTFAIAEDEIDLICPWLSRAVINEEFISLVHKAIARGVTVKIIYGIGTDDSNERQRQSEQVAAMLKTRFSWTDRLHLRKDNTHIKYLICDEKYMMCGSYNLLSFTADYEGNDIRDEGMEYIIDRNQIIQRRRQLFSWE